MQFQADQIIESRYRIIELIGHGASSTVYKAEDLMLKTLLALKILSLPQSDLEREKVFQRFMNEARILSRLSSPSIVKVLKYGLIENSIPYLALELVSGLSLRDLLLKNLSEQKVFNCTEALAIGRKLAEAMEAAHAQDIVHRDLKPENIIVEKTDECMNLKLLDFGFSRVQQAGNTATSTQAMIGTINYMSPEQCCGKSVDRSSDIYAFGAIMFEMLTGRPPFQAGTAAETMLLQMNTKAPSLLALCPGCGLPEELDALIQKCLQKEKENRFSSFTEILEKMLLLERLESTASFSDKNSGLQTAQKSKKNLRQLLLLSPILLVILLALNYGSFGKPDLASIIKSGPDLALKQLPDLLEKCIKSNDRNSVDKLLNEIAESRGLSSWQGADREKLYGRLALICMKNEMSSQGLKLALKAIKEFQSRLYKLTQGKYAAASNAFHKADYSTINSLCSVLIESIDSFSEKELASIIASIEKTRFRFFDVELLSLFHLRSQAFASLKENSPYQNKREEAKDLLAVCQLSIFSDNESLAQKAYQSLEQLSKEDGYYKHRAFQARNALLKFYLERGRFPDADKYYRQSALEAQSLKLSGEEADLWNKLQMLYPRKEGSLSQF